MTQSASQVVSVYITVVDYNTKAGIPDPSAVLNEQVKNSSSYFILEISKQRRIFATANCSQGRELFRVS